MKNPSPLTPIQRPKACILLIAALLTLALSVHGQTGTGLLWQVTGKNIHQPTYLFGTIHLYDTVHYKLPNEAFAKLPTIKKLWLELDFGKLNAGELMGALWITDSTRYFDRYLDSAVLRKLSRITAASPILKFFGKKIYTIKPLFISTFLVANGNSTQLDMELYTRALALKDSVGGIETIAEQLAAIDAISIADQAKMLSDMVKAFTTTDAMIEQMTRTYIKQDIDHMMEEMNQSMPLDANFNDILVVQRNNVMLSRIEPLLGKESMMIAVGAGHLGGANGLVKALKKKGYKLKSIPVVFQPVTSNHH